MRDLDLKSLYEWLHYDANTGLFTWKTERGGRKIGEIAGNTHHSGYRRIRINDREYRAHRLAWFYVYGEWPNDAVDHINRKRDDNRIANLREATRNENLQNKRPYKRKHAGLPGTSLIAGSTRWRAYIQTDGITKNLGCYATTEEAHAAYLSAKKLHHPFFTLHTVTGLASAVN